MPKNNRPNALGLLPYNPRTDLSPKFIFWFWFFPALILFVYICWGSFQDFTVTEPVFDSNGMPVDREAFENYIFTGEVKNSDYPTSTRVIGVLIVGVWVVYWGLRLQAEMLIFRKLSWLFRRLFND